MSAQVAPHQPAFTVPYAPYQGYAYSFMENQLKEAVKSSMRNELYANASFLCERLYAEVKNEDVRLLLAECYLGKKHLTLTDYPLGEGKAYKSYEVLRGSQSNANRYKFAITCLKLNKLAEAEKALLNRNSKPTLQQDQSWLI